MGEFITCFVDGLRDSFRGVGILYRQRSRDAITVTVDDPVAQRSPPATVLAQRRALEMQKSGRKEIPSQPLNPPKKKTVWQIWKDCFGWNIIAFGLCLGIFQFLLLPMLTGLSGFILHLTVGESNAVSLAEWSMYWLFGLLWVLPVYVITKILNVIFFQDIANASWQNQSQSHRGLKTMSVSVLIADIIFSVLTQAIFLVQTNILAMMPIPYLADVIIFIHLSLLYSTQTYEYRWYNEGKEVMKRSERVHSNWPYFMGFGAPMAALTMFLSPISTMISGVALAAVFPIVIISSYESHTKHPLPGTFTNLPIFNPSLRITNLILRRLHR